MTATAHALVGGAIAASVSSPELAIPLAMISHPILDMVPHWDFGKGWRDKSKIHFVAEGAFDLCLGFVLSYIIFGQNISFWYFVIVVFSSLLFDLLQTPYWFLDWKFPPFSWAYRFGSFTNGSAKLPWGILNQVVSVLLIILVLRVFH